MVLSKTVLIKKPTGKYFKYYREFGYDVSLDKIEINIKHLSHGSKCEVLVKCDYCGDIKKLSYNSYNKSTKNDTQPYACKNCGSIKQKDICVEKWGVENYFQLDRTKEKIKSTNLEKYGVEHYAQTEECKKRTKETNLEKLGVDNPLKSKKIKDKVKQTNLEKYGVEHYTQTEECKKRTKETNLEKYGVEHYTQTEECKKRTKETNLEKYGVEHYSQTRKFIEAVKNTNLDRYGVEHYSQTEEFKDKFKLTNLDRYGVEHYSQTEEFKNKFKLTNIDRYGVDNYSKTDECRQKVKVTNLERFGVECVLQSDKVKEKTKETNLNKYGVISYTQTKEFKDRFKETMLNRYGVDNINKNELYRINNFSISQDAEYIKYVNDGYSLFKCPIGHEFLIHSDNYFHRKKSNLPLCTICYPIDDLKSIKEKELIEHIKSVYEGDIVESYRDGGLEIDIYLPELKLGFEFNGLYYHSERFKDKNYHLNKTNHFSDRGIRIIHIWEDDWDYRNDIIRSQINNYLKISNKIYARKCIVKEIDNKISRDFLEKNHIQGSYKQIKKSLGVYYKNELVSVMTFDQFEGRKKMNNCDWNLSRFCNKLNFTVIGGASKMLKFFINNYHVERIVSYADKDWSIGILYEKLNFEKLYETKPDYKYIIKDKRIHKSNFKKMEVESKVFFSKIYDCGKIKYQLLLS